jgi:hypothetical protein
MGAAPEAAAAAATAVQQPAVEHLPSLVLYGRCCLQLAEHLEHLAPRLLAPSAVQQEQQQEQQQQQQESLPELHEESAALVCAPGLQPAKADVRVETTENLIDTMCRWVRALEAPALPSPLAAAGCSPQQLQQQQQAVLTQLAAAGCAPQQLQQQLDLLLAAEQGAEKGLTDASLAALVQQLQVTGRMLCSIAVPHFCNNPACGNLSGTTDVLMVLGRSCLCAGCLTARYCGRDCQRAAWKQHKPVCKALAAAAAAAQ